MPGPKNESGEENRAAEVAALMKVAPKLERLASKGIRRNAAVTFGVKLPGQDWYQLLTLLEGRAVGATNYLDTCEAVYFVERLRQQLKAQGF
jgi:hypothetical protein